MGYRTLIATGVVAVAGLGVAGGAMAAPQVTGVDAIATGKHRLSVGVTTLRGASTVAPRITVSVNRRVARARVSDWDAALAADDTVQSYARFRHLRTRSGATLTIRVRACDTDCAVTTHTVTVTGKGDGTDPSAPLPPGSVDAAGAVKAALAFVGNGSSLLEVERADEDGAAWEVKVLRADFAKVKVYVNADGTIAGSKVVGLRTRTGWDDGKPGAIAPPPLPAGAIGPDQASTIAITAIGPGSTVLEIERRYGVEVVWEVKVQRADGVRFEVKIAADGTVVRIEQHA